MRRTGSLAFSRIALLAILAGWAGAALGQSSAQTSQADGQWEAQSAGEHQPSYRRAKSSAGAWKPTRSAKAQAQLEDVSQVEDQTRTWIAPTQSAGRAKVAAKSHTNKQPSKPAMRAPRPFVAPDDAEQLSAAGQQETSLVTSAAPTKAKSQQRPSTNSAATPEPLQASRSAVHSNDNASQGATPAQRSTHDRVAYRPRPTPSARRSSPSGGLFDDSWIRPLKQVVYQAGANEPEELYAPPGEEGSMSTQGGSMPMQGGPMMGPDMQSDGEWIGSPAGGPSCDGSCGPDCECGPMCGDGVDCCSTCDSGGCSDLCSIGPHDDESCHTVRIRLPKFQEVMIFGGVHGFKGPYDQDRDSGNFGFQEGFNIGAKLPFTETGYQFGYQAVQSQLSGDADTGITDAFSQHFATVGVFRRVPDGFQGGIAWDWLLDERSSSVSFSQLRAEFGFVDCGCHEIGVMGAVHLRDNTFTEVDTQQQTTVTTFQSADQFLLYYRMHGCRGGEGRVYAGLTDDADGIIGSDFLLPLTDCWSLQPAFTYLIPRDNGGTIAAREEAWNIGINLVWHWKGHARSCHSSPYRPLFNVADNGSMIIDNRP